MKTMTSLTDRCIDYLNKYAAKDLAAMEDFFAEDIHLRDWKISVYGKAKALEETEKNFEAADSITIDVLTTHANDNSVAAELKITVDQTEVLYVVDVVSFNSQGQIAAIRAYLGRGDSAH